MPELPEAPDPAATDETSDNARDGTRKRRDPNEPVSVVGIGASAGGIAPLQHFFDEMKPDSGLAFVVVMHLSPDFESQLAEVLQQKTKMPVVQVTEAVKVQPNHVYVIPPNHQLTFDDGMLRLLPPQQAQGRRVTIDLFFRTLAHAYGQRAVAIIMSGTDQDGMIGLKHVRAQGGVTIAQEPEEAEFDSMPQHAIGTGMVDWVLHVGDMPERLIRFARNEDRMQLPPEILGEEKPNVKVPEAAGGETISDETRDPEDEEALLLVLKHLRAHTGQDFSHYKRATVLRRIARRLQVNSLETIPSYLEFLRGHPAEANALLHDLLIGVTHFFRDQASFAALEANIPQLFAGKKHTDELRIWVTACATGEEAYSITMLLCEHAAKLNDPPNVQVFATDIDEQSIHTARDGLYPATIEADVSQERLREFFIRDNGGYRVKKDIRDRVLFARHNVLSDPAFSRVDLVTCRNLLIYLNREAQQRVFDIFHFALRPGGLLFIGGAESADSSHSLFSPIDNHHRIYVRRSVPRPTWSIPALPARIAAPRRGKGAPDAAMLPGMTTAAVEDAGEHSQKSNYEGQGRRSVMFGELHLKLLEQYGPPSVVVNEVYDIVHLSENVGRYLQFRAGEPSTNLVTVINPALRVELRTALFRAGQSKENVIVPALHATIAGETETIDLQVRPMRPTDSAQGFFLVLFEKRIEPLTKEEQTAERVTISHQVGDELQSLKEQLNATVEQFEVSSEELKASNEELQAMNEELRSAAEELETSKEELQSVNEELTTVNHELKEKVEELSRANGDLNNLMTSTDLATIFLDRQLRVVRFTPRVADTFNLLPADVGRPISDITHKLRYTTLIADAEKVLERLSPVEREIATEDGRTFLARFSPYRTLDDKISGVVVTLIDVSQVKQVEAELRDSERKFRLLSDTAPALIWFNDADGNNQNVNQRYLDFTGKTQEEVAGKRWHLIVHPDDRDEVVAAYESAQREQRPYHSVARVQRADGEWRWIESYAQPLFDSAGVYQGHVGVSPDITDRKRAEESLTASEGRFRGMFEQASVGIVEIAEDRYARANPGFCRLVGYSADELKQMTVEELCHPEDYPLEEELRRELASGKITDCTLEKRYLHKDGTAVWTTKTMTQVREGDGSPYILAIVSPIGDRKKAEELLRGSEERFRTLADNVPQLIWTNNEEGTADYFNKRWYNYTGLSYEESHGPGWQAVVHPDDEAEATDRWTESLRRGEVFESEYRLRGGDGEYRWFIGRNVPLRTEGVVQSWFGSATDIDDLQKAQAKLAETEERFRVLVEGARDYAMFLLDSDNLITFWSKGAEKVLGWTREEAIGRKGDMIFTPEDKEKGAVESEINTALKDGRAPDRRFHLRKDGSRFWADGVLMRLDDEDGKLRGFAKVARDASDQRAVEDALRHARDEMEQRVVERTQDLLTTNHELEQTMAQRQQLEKELLEISEREKRRIGEDLHDMVCQELTATALILRSSANKVASESQAAAELLEESAQIVNRNVGLTRDLARGLQPADLRSTGLKQALKALAEQACETGKEIKCHFKAGRGTRVTDDTIALHLYRVAQEAVKNAIKHSGAKNILISLDHNTDNVCVSVQDDGKGFSPKRRSKGLGLHIMRYRANALGGELKIEKRRTGGMDITCVIPTKGAGKK